MKNNLTEKDIEVLNKWAEAYDIDELKIKDKEKIFNLSISYFSAHLFKFSMSFSVKLFFILFLLFNNFLLFKNFFFYKYIF